jgi:hypothetical protein
MDVSEEAFRVSFTGCFHTNKTVEILVGIGKRGMFGRRLRWTETLQVLAGLDRPTIYVKPLCERST